MRNAIDAVAEMARWTEWRQVQAPTLLVRGQSGTTTTAEVEHMLALRPDVQHTVIPDAGHDAHLDQHSAWVKILRDFLDRA
jgi:pimeloyl-ACP methyl ester carboxylesterase